ncbi:MAG TPA: hypothetical protein PLT75_12550 [Spirochaetota bacterium]|nr:hypothetical protein [Spirochaetota bacterium]
MKVTEFPLKRLDDFAAQAERELQVNPLRRTPFGLSREGDCISPWEMSFRVAGLLRSFRGCNMFGSEELVLITVLPTGTGIHPLSPETQYGWTGKINEFVAEMAVWWAFEITSENEAAAFMKAEKPVVTFRYSDSNGPGEMTVKYNGEFWVIDV